MFVALFACAAIGGTARAQERTPSRAFDGRWFVSLVCDDTQDRKGQPVKGYPFDFWAVIDHGSLQGQYGEAGKPSSVVFTGTVQADGAIEIRATGNSGHAEYTIGSLPQGTVYGYTMTGRLGETGGTVVRREVRPCKATIAKKATS